MKIYIKALRLMLLIFLLPQYRILIFDKLAADVYKRQITDDINPYPCPANSTMVVDNIVVMPESIMIEDVYKRQVRIFKGKGIPLNSIEKRLYTFQLKSRAEAYGKNAAPFYGLTSVSYTHLFLSGRP